MPFTLNMPKLSPTMIEGTIVKWHKSPGDFVKEQELILEVATDKATIEYNCYEEGYLRKILVEEGQNAALNQPIAIFSKEKDENIEGFHTEEKKVVHHDKPDKDKINQFKEEKPQKEACNVDEAEKTFSEPVFVPEEPLEKIDFSQAQGDVYDRILASPLAKKIAKQKNLDLFSVKGSGPNGRIVSRDLDLAQPDSPVRFGQKPYPSDLPGVYDEEKPSPMKKALGEKMKQAKQFIPHFYVSQTIDMSALVSIREGLKKENIFLSINDFIVRATAIALQEHPEINSGYNSKNQTIIRFKTVDISVAVSIEEGIITPIVRYANYKNIGQISMEIKYLAKKARDNKLAATEYKGGSFTISNLGMFGITEFYAVLNPPQSAILAVGGIYDMPIIKNNKIVKSKAMKLNLSCDHRVVDGPGAAIFLKTMQKYLESPALLLIG